MGGLHPARVRSQHQCAAEVWGEAGGDVQVSFLWLRRPFVRLAQLAAPTEKAPCGEVRRRLWATGELPWSPGLPSCSLVVSCWGGGKGGLCRKNLQAPLCFLLLQPSLVPGITVAECSRT